MARATRSKHNANPEQLPVPRTRKTPLTRQEKNKSVETEAAPAAADERPAIEEIMGDAPVWAQALFLHMDRKIDLLGDYVQGMDSELERVKDQVMESLRIPPSTNVIGASSGAGRLEVVIVDIPTPMRQAVAEIPVVMVDADKWAKLVERRSEEHTSELQSRI